MLAFFAIPPFRCDRAALEITLPGLPQNRACGITAHGFSKHCCCVSTHLLQRRSVAMLFATFTLTRLQMSEHPPCFTIASQCFDGSLPSADSS